MFTGDCRIKTGISAAVAAALCPGHEDDDDDDDDDIGGLVAVAAATHGPGLDWLNHADDIAEVDADSVGCDSCRSSWCGCDAGIVCAPTHANHGFLSVRRSLPQYRSPLSSPHQIP